MFSCEFWEIFKSTFFEEQLRTTASKFAYLALKLAMIPKWRSSIKKDVFFASLFLVFV